MSEKTNIDRYDEENAFKEEADILQTVDARLDKLAAPIMESSGRYQQWIDDIDTRDNEDRQNALRLKESQSRFLDQLYEMRQLRNSPYFGHFECKTAAQESESFLVGKQAVADGSDVIILDWRDPLGHTFYNKQARSFQINGYQYTLLLRRAVDIKNGQLAKVHTEYDSMNLSLDGEVIDPFLISVLQDKRRDYSLTDIIRTIQSNQNNIIEQPPEKSFIVQGCAGSGKTMILLHRLSYIAFNHPKTDFSRYCILTPHESFNLHIDELSKSLGLDKIQRYTVEAFYAFLINRRGYDDDILTTNGRMVKACSDTADGLTSEKMLNTDMLRKLYSVEFGDTIRQDFKSKRTTVKNVLLSCDIMSLLPSMKIDLSQDEALNFKVVRQLLNAVSTKIDTHRTMEAAYQEALRKQPDIQNALRESEAELTEAAGNIAECRDKLAAAVKSTRDDWAEKLEEVKAATNAHTSLKAEATATKADIAAKLTALQSISEQGKQIISGGLNYDYLLTSQDEIAMKIKATYPDECARMSELTAQLKNIPSYNFGRRARLKADISSMRAQFDDRIIASIQDYIAESDNAYSVLTKRMHELDSSFAKADSRLKTLLDSVKANEALMSDLDKLAKLLEKETYPEIPAVLRTNRLPCTEQVDEYRQAFTAYTKASKAATANRINAAELQSTIDHAQSKILDGHTIDRLLSVQEALAGFSFPEFEKYLSNLLTEQYTQFGQTVPPKAKYRHRLYLKLLLATQYYGPAKDFNYSIHIDEAQDLAVSEYLLLREVLGKNAVFNLYGDVNQAVYEYKGISDWSELEDIVTDNLYLLNENYRNTIEITDYCNKTFEAEVTAIGLSGPVVDNTPCQEGLQALLTIHESEPQKRLAVIYRRGLQGIDGILTENSKGCFIMGAIGQSKISVLAVEEAKGLEFDAVLVIENGMGINERYVSYTRALDKLMITTLQSDSEV